MVANASHKNDKTISTMPTSNEPTSTKNVKYRSQRVKSFEQKQWSISNAQTKEWLTSIREGTKQWTRCVKKFLIEGKIFKKDKH